MAGVTTFALPDTDLLRWYDTLGEDPPGYRLEILEGELLVSPSPGGEHQDHARSMANLLDVAVEGTGLRAREDFDWAFEHPVSGLGNRLRPNACVLDPEDPGAPRLVTVEVLSPSDHQRLVAGEPETRIEGKRRAYAYGGAQVHVEIEEGPQQLVARWYAREGGRFVEAGRAQGSEGLEVGGPYPFTVVPGELTDWLRRRMVRLRAAERVAEQERARAQQERARADQERARADSAEAELRRLRSG